MNEYEILALLKEHAGIIGMFLAGVVTILYLKLAIGERSRNLYRR